MRFTWSEAKRKLNLQQHGFDLVDAPKVFDGPTYTYEDDRFDYSEQRFVTLGVLALSYQLSTRKRPLRSELSLFVRRRSMSKRSSSKISKTDWTRVRAMSDRDISVSPEHPEASMKHIVRAIARRGLKPVPPNVRRAL